MSAMAAGFSSAAVTATGVGPLVSVPLMVTVRFGDRLEIPLTVSVQADGGAGDAALAELRAGTASGAPV